MSLLRSEQAKATNTPITSYSPIVRSTLHMEKPLQEKMRKKFDTCYVLAKENLAFGKYPAIHQLERRHGVDLGQSYTTKDSAKSFSYYTSQKTNVEDDLVVIMGFQKDDSAGDVGTFARYFSHEVPLKADANGLIECLQKAVRAIGPLVSGESNVLSKTSVLETKPIIVGGGIDGAYVNVVR